MDWTLEVGGVACPADDMEDTRKMTKRRPNASPLPARPQDAAQALKIALTGITGAVPRLMIIDVQFDEPIPDAPEDGYPIPSIAAIPTPTLPYPPVWPSLHLSYHQLCQWAS
jgi:hypothetical protein